MSEIDSIIASMTVVELVMLYGYRKVPERAVPVVPEWYIPPTGYVPTARQAKDDCSNRYHARRKAELRRADRERERRNRNRAA